jgi:hypothetical protein
MHHYIRMHLSALAPSPSRPGPAGRHLISGLCRRGVSSAAMCLSRGPPPASSSPLGASYSSPAAAHRMTPHNLTRPLYFPLSTHNLVEHPLKKYAERLDRVRGHHMTREQHASLSPAPQLTHAAAPAAEYVPVQHRDASVNRHEVIRVAVFDQLPSAARRHARILHLSSAPHFPPHTLLKPAHTHTYTASKVRVKQEYE